MRRTLPTTADETVTADGASNPAYARRVAGDVRTSSHGRPDATSPDSAVQVDRRIATAGWSIPRAVADQFPAAGSGLQRYAGCFSAVEINSTFYRSHRPATYARWVETTPDDFRFAVKLPRTITHEARLANALGLAAGFCAEAGQLGDKRGPLLVQLPPSLAFAPEVADPFFAGLRQLWPCAIVCEPRHASWFDGEADALLAGHWVGRVGADPARHPAAAAPGGWRGISYWRLHGSPRMYYSAYDEAALDALAADLRAASGEVWCVFDNTTSGAAAADALRLQAKLGPLGGAPRSVC